ncbi:hypothetical protein [Pectinatus frisingensis]|uniref:hypothetical protein n=1 Tax=Pectinatus frisingensis TaxID=865 RepID=UPI0018C82F37|nr:hypothetical protein [Pectinatus frisingensis]
MSKSEGKWIKEGKRIDKIYAEKNIAVSSCWGCKDFDIDTEDCCTICCRNFDLLCNWGSLTYSPHPNRFRPLYLIRKCRAKKIKKMSKLYVFYPQKKRCGI